MSSTAYFDEVAGQWDAMRREFFSERVREIACGRAALAPGLTVADVGAGSGFISEGLVGRGLRVVAVEPVAAMRAVLRDKLGGRADFTCLPGEAEALPLAAASCDRVFANMCLHHVERPAAAIAEMARVLRPGGRLLITDLDAHEHTFLLTEHHDRWPGFAREDVRAWFEAAGLRAVAVEDAGED